MAANFTKRDIVLDNIDNIKKWLSEGVTMTAIAKNLNVSKQTLYTYSKEFLAEDGKKGGLDAIKSARAPAVKALENSMYNAAIGGLVKVKKAVKLKHIEYENGKKAREWEEVQMVEETEYIKQDTTAGIFLLKNWGNYMNEPRAMEFRAKELELREKQVDANTW